MIRKTIFIFALLFLASCSKDGYISNVRTMRYIIRSEINDVRNQPIHTIEKEIENRIGDEKWITFINDLDHFQIAYPADYPAERPVSMRDMDILQSSSCPPLGVGEPTKIFLKDNEGLWGRTDFWDAANAMYFWRMRDEWRPNDIPPFCKPPLPRPEEQKYYVDCTGDEEELCLQKQRDYEVKHGLYSAYAFCAEKDGKAVAICIQQMTDDEAMAKEIFESFRWTE